MTANVLLMTTAREIAEAIQVSPRTRYFDLRDEWGIAYEGTRSELVLAAISRSDITPELSEQIHTVAYAIRKSMVTLRMDPAVACKIGSLSPYQVCALVAKVAAECPETTPGGICDDWIPRHQAELV